MQKLLFCLFLAVPSGVMAQQPARDVLQRQIVERLVQNFRAQGGLDDEQTVRFRAVFQRHFRDRRASEAAQRRVVRALESQLRPGVAADIDSLNALLSAVIDRRRARIELENEYQAEYGSFLSPVQHAQLILSLERFQRQIENLLRRRAAANRPNRN